MSLNQFPSLVRTGRRGVTSVESTLPNFDRMSDFRKDGHFFQWDNLNEKFYQNQQQISKEYFKKLLRKWSKQPILEISEFKIVLERVFDGDRYNHIALLQKHGLDIWLATCQGYVFFDDFGALLNVYRDSKFQPFLMDKIRHPYNTFFKKLLKYSNEDPELTRIILKGFQESFSSRPKTTPKSRVIRFTNEVKKFSLIEMTHLDSVLINEMDEDEEISLPIDSFDVWEIIYSRKDQSDRKFFFLLDYLNSGMLDIKISTLIESETYIDEIFKKEI